MFVCQWFATSTISQSHKYNRFLNCSLIFSMHSCYKEKSTLVNSKIPQPSCSGLGSQSTTICFDIGTVVGSSNEHWWIKARKIISRENCRMTWNIRYFKANCFQWVSQMIFGSHWTKLLQLFQSFKRQLQKKVAFFQLKKKKLRENNLFYFSKYLFNSFLKQILTNKISLSE